MKGWRSLLLVAVALLAPSHALADPRGVGGPPEPLTPEAIEARRVQQVADIKAWLPRLVGRFRYEGVVNLNGEESGVDVQLEAFRAEGRGFQAITEGEESEGAPKWTPAEYCPDDAGPGWSECRIKRVHGVGDCVAIGTGPGVHFVIDVIWPDVGILAGAVVRGEEPFLSPATTLYGIDANAASIRYLLLDKDGLTETESAVVKGNTLRWVFYTGEAEKTRRVTRIHAPPDGSVVRTTIEIEQLTPSGWRLLASIVFDGRRVPAGDTLDGS